MRLLGIVAALAIGLAGGSAALAQHGNHHGGGGMGSGDKSKKMSCCTAESDMCDPATCPGHLESKDGVCDMSKCCGAMMSGEMGDMHGDHHEGGSMGDMGDMMGDHHGTGDSKGGMMCGASMKCCRKSGEKASAKGAKKPTLK